MYKIETENGTGFFHYWEKLKAFDSCGGTGFAKDFIERNRGKTKMKVYRETTRKYRFIRDGKDVFPRWDLIETIEKE